MSNIPKEIIEDILQKARIEDIIGRFIKLDKKGNGYMAVCPFHNDSNPSLSISTDKQIYKCYSCPGDNKAGNVYNFVMKYKHVDFPEAVRMVAEMIGYQYDFGTYNKNTFEETIYHKLMKEAMVYCHYVLNSTEGSPVKKQLQERDIDNNIIDKFMIGYNPSGNMLYNYLIKKGYKEADIVKANLANIASNGLNDVFYNRIMIPIMDINGHPIGFTARRVDQNTPSKYINSTDTPIFAKGDALFNIHRAKEGAKGKKVIIIAEGPMDVIAFDKAGFATAVCSMGTSTTKNQLSLIKKYADTVLLAYDGDKAGQAAILKNGKLALEMGLKVMVLNNQTNCDPDEIVRKYGVNELQEMVNKPITWIEFLFNHYQKEYDLNNLTARKEFATLLLNEIANVEDRFERESYLNQLSNLTGYSQSFLINNQPIQIGPKKDIDAPYKPIVLKMTTGLEKAEKIIIKQMFASKKAIELFKTNLKELPDKDYNDLAMVIINYVVQNDEIKVNSFINENSQFASLVFDISEDENLIDEFNEKLVLDSIRKIKEKAIDKQIEALKAEMKQYQDGHVIAKFAEEIAQLKKEKAILLNERSIKERGN